jgi:hypothetical protein
VDRSAFLEVHVLSQQTETDVSRAHDVASIGSLFSGDEAKNGRLSRSIASD